MAKQFKNNFAWSVSRDRVFRECPRRYYYNHYGFWSGWEPQADERTRQIYILKQLAYRPTWIGSVVHDCIAHSLRNVSHNVKVLDVDEILDLTRKRMRQQFRESRAHQYRQNPKEYHGLFEHEYAIDVSDAEWRDAADTVDRCLRNFYGSAAWRELAATKAADFLEIERLSSCDFNGVKMNIKLDCATRSGERLVIWDWKTGRREERGGLSLQMACYAYYAQQRFKVDLSNVVTRRFNLHRNEVYEDTINSAQLEDLLSYVRGSIKDMFSMLDDPDKNTTTEERFRKEERAELSRRCNFLKVCEPSLD